MKKKEQKKCLALKGIIFWNYICWELYKTTQIRIKTASKRAIQKTAEATGDLTGNKTANKITKKLPQNTSKRLKVKQKYQTKDIYLQKKDNKSLMN